MNTADRLRSLFAASALFFGAHILPRNALAADVSPAWTSLMAGNGRYVAGTVTLGRDVVQQRAALVKSQRPIAIVVACSDSRVVPEFVFDQGLGRLFVIRTAGNLVDIFALGSIEYAVGHFNVGLIVVLGHERCGAVDAAVNPQGHATGNLAALVHAIRPVAGADAVDATVVANAGSVANQIRQQAKIPDTVQIVAARYDLDSGEVTKTRSY